MFIGSGISPAPTRLRVLETQLLETQGGVVTGFSKVIVQGLVSWDELSDEYGVRPKNVLGSAGPGLNEMEVVKSVVVAKPTVPALPFGTTLSAPDAMYSPLSSPRSLVL